MSDASRLELLKRAEALADDGRWEESIRLCEEALLDDPESAAALNLKGYCLVSLGRVRDALPSFKLARLYLPVYAPIRYNLARALEETGDLKGALAEYDQALELDGGDVKTRLSRAGARLSAGDVQGSRADMEDALGREPGNGLLWLSMSAWHLAQGEKDRARERLRRALELDPGLRAKAGPLLDELGEPRA